MKKSRLFVRPVLLAALILPAAMPSARAGEPGELFPNVPPYDETVSNPITSPQHSIAHKPPARSPAMPSKPAQAAPQSTPASVPVSRPEGPMEMLPYSRQITGPLLSPEDQKTFSSTYAAAIEKALAGSVDERRTTATVLEDAAEKAASPDLKRYMLLNALGLYIRAAAPLAEREKKAEQVLPLLTERSLSVLQARADAVDDLLATISVSPNQNLVELSLDTHATLAKLQVQAGFPKDAQKSLKKAREALVYYQKKDPARIDELAEAAAWCERANVAAALWPGLQAKLKSSPDDPFTNTALATLHLSLYGNLENAAPFAAKSNRKDLKALAELLNSKPAASQKPADQATRFLAIVDALVEVAQASSNSQPFDRYSIACYAGDHLAEAIDQLPEDKKFKARLLLASAKGIVDKTGIKRGPDLPEWLAPVKTATTAEAPQVKKNTPIFLGEWTVVTSSGWRGNMTINADGTVTEEANHGRHWTLANGKLVIDGATTDTFDVITKDKMTGINSHNRTTAATRPK